MNKPNSSPLIMQIQKTGLSAIELARQSAGYLRRRGYPFLSIEVHADGDFPHVSLWQDEIETVFIIAYFDDPAQEAAAIAFANALAEQEEYGALAWVASSNCVIRVEDMQTRRW